MAEEKKASKIQPAVQPIIVEDTPEHKWAGEIVDHPAVASQSINNISGENQSDILELDTMFGRICVSASMLDDPTIWTIFSTGVPPDHPADAEFQIQEGLRDFDE